MYSLLSAPPLNITWKQIKVTAITHRLYVERYRVERFKAGKQSYPTFCPVHTKHLVLVSCQVIQRSLTAVTQEHTKITNIYQNTAMRCRNGSAVFYSDKDRKLVPGPSLAERFLSDGRNEQDVCLIL